MPALVAYKEYQRNKDKNQYNWQLPEYLLDKLTLLQLDSLGDLDKDTYTDNIFRKAQFRKRFDVRQSLSRPN